MIGFSKIIRSLFRDSVSILSHLHRGCIARLNRNRLNSSPGLMLPDATSPFGCLWSAYIELLRYNVRKFNDMSKRRPAGLILFFLGIGMLLVALPLSSEFDRQDSLPGNLIRNFVTGEIVIREGVIEVVPDRDERISSEFREYLTMHPEIAALPAIDAIDAFYEARYRGRMYRNELGMKLEKKKVITKREKIAVPYRYIAIVGVVTFMGGVVFIILPKKKRPRGSI